MSVEEAGDRLAIRQLIDAFAGYAGGCDADGQTEHFTLAVVVIS
jgi:hypothetical protein